MKRLKQFLAAYWKHARHTTDGLLFLLALLATFLARDVRLLGWIGVLVIIGILLIASMRTWEHERSISKDLRQKLREATDNRLTMDKLNAAQQDILRTLASTEGHSVSIIPVLGSHAPVFLGLESIASRYDYDRFRAAIEDLAHKDVLSVTYTGMHNTPMFSPTNNFYALLDGDSVE